MFVAEILCNDNSLACMYTINYDHDFFLFFREASAAIYWFIFGSLRCFLPNEKNDVKSESGFEMVSEVEVIGWLPGWLIK